MTIFTAPEPPKLPPLIETVIEIQTPEPIQEEPMLTWRDNPQGCNEDIEYIAAEEPFYCIPKRNTSQRQKAVKQAPVASQTLSYAPPGWFDWGWCTYYVSTRRPVGLWNNARDWVWQAQRDGYATGSTPRVGAIGQRGNHVVYVESVSGGSVTVSEMNYEGFGVISSRTVPANYFTYIY